MTEDFFRDRLRFLRNEKHISAREMSLSLGQNESYINKIETGKASISITSFLNICEFLNISPSDFFNPEVKNSASIQEIIKYYKALNPHQAKYILELLKDLNKCTNIL
ncbi:XRE family transcriptional regulator [Treponema rectale]|uniref:Transcriptional regulator with XRE-family HTH domain n=1 Tax=Treponema rectale TaxID=744512 RepID=A0A840SHQ8_9SPIR|nr:helix-turn-helix transcriptional regulator [Treponema rectale]MBB5218922.1 transcriptional regulator with XRE-family HTH domain [Treponema rectale]QOS41163.1 XRE family transcriptional regulator [Treponema rectale]